MVIDERKCKELTITNNGSALTIRLRRSNGGYISSFVVTINPTSNCQLASANAIGQTLSDLNKYHIRDLFINLKKRLDKKILLLDLNSQYVNHIKECIPASAIIGDMPYTSTNRHSMHILLIRLSSIKQLQLPK